MEKFQFGLKVCFGEFIWIEAPFQRLGRFVVYLN